MLRRGYGRVLAALSLGVLSTIIIAWTVALVLAHSENIHGGSSMATIFPYHQIPTPDGDVGLTASTSFGYTDVYTCPRWTIADPSAFDPYYPTPDRVAAVERALFGEPPWPVPGWAILPRAADKTLLWNATHAYGWPARALTWVQEQRRLTPGGPMSHGIRYGRIVTIPSTQYWQGVLPFRPILSGLAIDAAVYAAAWWALLTGLVTLRRHLRRRRKLCAHCKYNLQGIPSNSPCPECGRA